MKSNPYFKLVSILLIWGVAFQGMPAFADPEAVTPSGGGISATVPLGEEPQAEKPEILPPPVELNQNPPESSILENNPLSEAQEIKPGQLEGPKLRNWFVSFYSEDAHTTWQIRGGRYTDGGKPPTIYANVTFVDAVDNRGRVMKTWFNSEDMDPSLVAHLESKGFIAVKGFSFEVNGFPNGEGGKDKYAYVTFTEVRDPEQAIWYANRIDSNRYYQERAFPLKERLRATKNGLEVYQRVLNPEGKTHRIDPRMKRMEYMPIQTETRQKDGSWKITRYFSGGSIVFDLDAKAYEKLLKNPRNQALTFKVGEVVIYQQVVQPDGSTETIKTVVYHARVTFDVNEHGRGLSLVTGSTFEKPQSGEQTWEILNEPGDNFRERSTYGFLHLQSVRLFEIYASQTKARFIVSRDIIEVNGHRIKALVVRSFDDDGSLLGTWANSDDLDPRDAAALADKGFVLITGLSFPDPSSEKPSGNFILFTEVKTGHIYRVMQDAAVRFILGQAYPISEVLLAHEKSLVVSERNWYLRVPRINPLMGMPDTPPVQTAKLDWTTKTAAFSRTTSDGSVQFTLGFEYYEKIVSNLNAEQLRIPVDKAVIIQTVMGPDGELVQQLTLVVKVTLVFDSGRNCSAVSDPPACGEIDPLGEGVLLSYVSGIESSWWGGWWWGWGGDVSTWAILNEDHTGPRDKGTYGYLAKGYTPAMTILGSFYSEDAQARVNLVRGRITLPNGKIIFGTSIRLLSATKPYGDLLLREFISDEGMSERMKEEVLQSGATLVRINSEFMGDKPSSPLGIHINFTELLAQGKEGPLWHISTQSALKITRFEDDNVFVQTYRKYQQKRFEFYRTEVTFGVVPLPGMGVPSHLPLAVYEGFLEDGNIKGTTYHSNGTFEFILGASDYKTVLTRELRKVQLKEVTLKIRNESGPEKIFTMLNATLLFNIAIVVEARGMILDKPPVYLVAKVVPRPKRYGTIKIAQQGPWLP